MIDANDRFNAVITFQHGQYTRILSPTSILDIRASYGRFTSKFPDAQTSTVTAASLAFW